MGLLIAEANISINYLFVIYFMCELTHGMAGERHGRGMGTVCRV